MTTAPRRATEQSSAPAKETTIDAEPARGTLDQNAIPFAKRAHYNEQPVCREIAYEERRSLLSAHFGRTGENLDSRNADNVGVASEVGHRHDSIARTELGHALTNRVN